MMRGAPLLLSSTLLFAAGGEFVTETEEWRAGYEARLKAPQGWLSVAGLFWLKQGENRIGSAEGSEIRLPARCAAHAGTIVFDGTHATLHASAGSGLTVNGKPAETAELASDQGHPPDVVEHCGVAITFIQRGARFGIRLRDPEAATRREFQGLHWFPADEKYSIHATWHPYDPPKAIPVTNILGDTQDEPSPGYAEFALNGRQFRLEPVIEEPDELFFMFRDLTSADSTYGSGRFLKTAMPKDGSIELDFNRAYNPPCAYIEFATCPLPPRQNRLSLRIEAGEKRYGTH